MTDITPVPFTAQCRDHYVILPGGKTGALCPKCGLPLTRTTSRAFRPKIQGSITRYRAERQAVVNKVRAKRNAVRRRRKGNDVV